MGEFSFQRKLKRAFLDDLLKKLGLPSWLFIAAALATWLPARADFISSIRL
jgi:hypothetical protein